MRRCRISILAACIVTLLIFSTTPARAGTITVDTLLDGIGVSGFCTLREAIARANAGSDGEGCTGVTASPNTILLPLTGSYTLTAGSQLSVTSDITIQETGGATAVIEAATAPNTVGYRVFNVNGASAALRLDGITVRNGGTSSTDIDGGCISLGSGASLFLTNGTVVEACHVLGAGGAIYGTNTPVTITNSTVQNSSATEAFADGGGVRVSTGALTLSGATIHNNTAISTTNQAIGGGINYSGTALTITNSIISDNIARATGGTTFGGGLWMSMTGGSATITGSIFRGNRAIDGLSNFGGAIRVSNGNLSISSSEFTNNTVSGGTSNTGAVFNVNNGTLTVTNSRIQDNGSAAATRGSVLEAAASASVSITGSCIVRNIDSTDQALYDINATNLTTATNNWWGTAWGPRIVGAGGGSAVSNGDSITGNGTSAVDVGLTSSGSLDVAPTGNWQTVAPTVAGETCLTCTGVSSVTHARACS